MRHVMDRRSFSRSIATAAAGALIPAAAGAPGRRLRIGHTCITWSVFPTRPGRMEGSENLEAALKDISSLGYNGFETFPENLEDWDKKGQLSALIDRYKLPLTSAYIVVNLIDPAVRKEMVDSVIRRAKVIKKYGGNFAVLAPNGMNRQGYDFRAHETNIIASLNDYAMAVNDAGLNTGLHQHTGTCIESREEVYAVMEKANTKHLKFAPDVGQLQKGGSDAAQVVKDFLPITVHMHLKDFKGWDHFAGYCPLGQGRVDIQAILDMVEKKNPKANIMVELDPSKGAPMTPLETAQTTKAYLLKLGYKFRS